MVRDHRDLAVWQKAMNLVEACYHASETFPKSEIYGLTSQLRRAAVSVPANIAEGRGRRSTADYLQFVSIAKGSLAELETHIELAKRLGYLRAPLAEQLGNQTQEIARMLVRMRQTLNKKLVKV